MHRARLPLSDMSICPIAASVFVFGEHRDVTIRRSIHLPRFFLRSLVLILDRQLGTATQAVHHSGDFPHVKRIVLEAGESLSDWPYVQRDELDIAPPPNTPELGPLADVLDNSPERHPARKPLDKEAQL